jgi:hypothetical protein
MIHVIAFCIAFACCLIYTFRFGGEPERAAMLAETVALILTIIAIHFFPQAASFHGSARALFLIDVSLLLVMTCIALKANRLWTIVLAGLQLTTVLVHISRALYPALPAASYGIFAQFWAWPILLTTALGAYRHKMRTRKFGEERDWKPLWPHSVPAQSTT